MDKNKKLGLGIVVGVPVALAGVVGATLAMQKPEPAPQEEQIITSTNPVVPSMENPGLVVGENLEHFKDFGAKVRAQANIINTAIKAREDLTNFVPTIPNEETEPAPVIQADEGYELPESYSSLQATNIHLEDEVYGFSFEKDIPYEVIGYFEGAQTNRMKVISLKILNKPVEKFGWEIILFPKGDKWYFDFTRRNSNGVYNSEEISIELRGDIALELNNQLRSHFKFNAVEDIPEPTWREKFGASELKVSEHPRINYPPKRIEQVNYQAPVIKVPANPEIWQDLSSNFGDFFSDDPNTVDARKWFYLSSKSGDKKFRDHKINLRNEKYGAEGLDNVFTLPIQGTKYYLEYGNSDIASPTYRIFIIKTRGGFPIYLNPETGEETTASTKVNLEFRQGSHNKMYQVAKLHQSWLAQQSV